MQLMKRQNIIIASIVFALLLSSTLAVTFGNLNYCQSTANMVTLEVPTTPPSQVQVISPIDNYTYGSYKGPENISSDQAAHETTYNLILPLNITANQKTSKVTYSLDGSDNTTFNENTTASLTLSYGVHNLTVYATNNEGKDSKSNVTFTVGYGYPLSTTITMEQVQEATRYFESRGLKVQVENVDENKWQNIWSLLYAGSVDVVSKENFADIIIEHGIDTIWLYRDSNHISFYFKIYGNSWLPMLPIFYAYSATLT
jgi:hypothetical protein